MNMTKIVLRRNVRDKCWTMSITGSGQIPDGEYPLPLAHHCLAAQAHTFVGKLALAASANILIDLD